MLNLKLLCIVIFTSSCSLLFGEATSGETTPPAIDGGMVAIDGSIPPSDATVTDAGVDAAAPIPIPIVPAGNSTASTFVGSTGGQEFVSGGISCPETSMLYGVQVNTYKYSDDTTFYMCGLQAMCATLQIEAGEVKRVHHSMVTPNTDVGDCANVKTPEGPFQAVCPEHSVATGIILIQSPGADTTVIKAFTRAQLQCATIGPQLSLLDSRVSNSVGSTGHSMSVEYRTDCPTGMVATEINGRAGESIDQISFSCRMLKTN